MPLPMIHLAVAREYAKASANFAGLINCPEYYLGSISPDAVHMRPGTGKSDKGITHLLSRAELELFGGRVIVGEHNIEDQLPIFIFITCFFGKRTGALFHRRRM